MTRATVASTTANQPPPTWMTTLRPVFDDIPDHVARPAAGIDGDRRYSHRTQRRQAKDIRRVEDATRAIDHLPEIDEALHVIVAGGFSMFAVLQALVQLGQPAHVAELLISTLSFSKANVIDLAALIDTGRIVGRVSFLLSQFFRSHEAEPVAHLERELAARGGRVFAGRVHAKIIALRLSDGRAVVCEGSANIRSCRNIENLCLFGDPALFDFHATWINELFANAGDGPPGHQEAHEHERP